MKKLYLKEPVLCNLFIAIILMFVNHLAGSYAVELKAALDIAIVALTGASRQLVTPYYNNSKVKEGPSERSQAIPQEHSSTAPPR